MSEPIQRRSQASVSAGISGLGAKVEVEPEEAVGQLALFEEE